MLVICILLSLYSSVCLVECSVADPSRSPAHPCNMINNSFSRSPTDQRTLWSFPRNPLQKASSKEGESDTAELQHLQEEVARLNHVVQLSCSELKLLRSEHEMLQSRNQSLQQELDQRDLASRMADLDVTGGRRGKCVMFGICLVHLCLVCAQMCLLATGGLSLLISSWWRKINISTLAQIFFGGSTMCILAGTEPCR